MVNRGNLRAVPGHDTEPEQVKKKGFLRELWDDMIIDTADKVVFSIIGIIVCGVIVLILWGLLCGAVGIASYGFDAFGTNHRTAMAEAQAFAAGMDLPNPRVQCTRQASGGGVACTIAWKDAGKNKILPVKCAEYLSFDKGCIPATDVLVKHTGEQDKQ